MSNINVKVEAVSKKFGLSLKNGLKYGLLDSWRRLAGKGKDPNLREGEFWALRDVNFELEPGDALGIMGVNGSGKTTLLRILNGTYSPDAGKVTLSGRVGALIAAGAGFSPMLTGRENVFISGTLLGMKPAEIRKKFDEIVSFAALEEFIDMPVRNYSSGMAVRLGFAIAVLGNPDILLVDEVLAVGDLNFQKKCFERIETLKREGTTILLVSHSPGSIWAVCNKGLVMHRGYTDGIVDVETACRSYEQFNLIERMKSTKANEENLIASDYGGLRCGTGEVYIEKIQILEQECKNPINKIGYGESFTIRIQINSKQVLNEAIVRVSIDSEIYKCFSIIDSYEASGKLYELPQGKCVVDIDVKKPNIRQGVYSLTAAILSKKLGIHLFLEHNMAAVIIEPPKEMFLYADTRAIVNLETIWNLKRMTKHD